MKKRILSISIVLMLIILLLPTMLIVPASAASEPTCQTQWSSPWQNYYYGDLSLWDSGCGIFAFSNAVWYLTGNQPSVTEVAQWAYNNNYFNGSYGGGSVRSIYEAAYNQYGSRFGFTLSGEGSGWSQDLKNHLMNGGVAIGNVPGHYIAIVGYDSSTDKFHIYDSAPGLVNATGTNGGNVWVTEYQLLYSGSSYGISGYYLNWYTKLTRTGAAPEWTGGSGAVNLGDNFYAFLSNTTNGETVYFSCLPNSDQVEGKTLDGSMSQIWQFIRQSDGSYEIASVLSGYRLDIASHKTDNGTSVHLYQDTDQSNQRWDIFEYDGGYRLIPKLSDKVALDCSTSTKKAQIWEKSGGDAQTFQITQLTFTPDDLGADFYATISTTAQGETVYFTSTADSDVVEGKAQENTQGQIWHFIRQSDGSYEIASALDERRLDVESHATDNGTAVHLWEDTDNANQRWEIYIFGDGYKLFSKLSTDMALDLDTSSKKSQIWQKSINANQNFFITKVEHTIGTAWEKDTTEHWHACATCEEKFDVAAHTYDQEIVSELYKKSDAACTEGAVYYKSCVCGATGSETFTGTSAIGHHNYGSDGVCSVCQQKLKLSAASLNLSQDIAVRFFVKEATVAGYDYYRLAVSFNGKSYTLSGEDATVGGVPYKRFTFAHIDPSLMAEEISVTLGISKDNKTWIEADAYHYSIATYCYNMLRADSSAAELKTLIVDLLNYGASMQKYFGKTSGFVNEALTAEEKQIGTQETPSMKSDLAISGDAETLVKWKGVLLNLNASITPKFYFVLNNGVQIENLTANITCNGRSWQSNAFVLTKLEGAEAYILEVRGLTILDLHETVTVTITDGTSTSQAITYSAETYAYRQQSGTDADLKELVISIMKYLNSTNVYFNPHGQVTSYTVTFLPNGATSGTMAAQTYNYGETVNLPINTFEKTDYVFAGWLGSDGKTYTNAQEILKTLSDGTSLELTAQWKSGLGFDISFYQANTSISTLQDYGIGYLILRAGYTGYGTGDTLNKDTSFEDFYTQAKALGIPVGAYWYSCANTYQEGWNEAKYMYENCLQGKTFELPIFMDVENNEHQTTDKAGVTAAINGFCDYLYSQNMYPAIYTYVAFCQYMDMDEISAKYDIGIAAYDVEKSWVDQNFTYGAYDMWQWTSTYVAEGLDANYIYRDYETLIKRFGLNGFTATESGAEFKTNIELAEEVIDGKWGNGDARIIALTAAGYDYTGVQEAVEYLLAA